MATRQIVSTGLKGLDFILGGGIPENHSYLVYGSAGTGKTTLGLQFLMAAAKAGKKCLFLTVLQDRRELEEIAATYGFNLDGIDIFDLPHEIRQAYTDEQTIFRTEDIEMIEVTKAVNDALDRYQPQCLVFESLSEINIVTGEQQGFRRQVLRIKQKLDTMRCTTIFTAGTSDEVASVLQTLFSGSIEMQQEFPACGRSVRRLKVSKMRQTNYYSGYHDFKIGSGGLTVFPRLTTTDLASHSSLSNISSGNDGVDTLLGGGLAGGTTCMVAGTTGAGKSVVSALFVDAAARRGQRSVVFNLDELTETYLQRSQALGMDMQTHIDNGLLDLRQLDIGELTPGQFGQAIRRTAEVNDTKIVVIDSLTGYLNATPNVESLVKQLYQLVQYLNKRDLLTFVIVQMHGLLGENVEVSIDASYLAEAVLLLRHFEHAGKVRKSISVLKKRYGRHEDTIRELDFSEKGVHVGPPLTEFTGVLSGRPEYIGWQERLIDKDRHNQ